MNNSLTIVIISLILIQGCNTASEESTNKSLERIDFNTIEFTELSKNLITEVVECTGVINVPPNERAAMFAPIGGNIKGIKVMPGDLVKKGQILYSLSHQDIIKVQEEFLIAYNEEKLQRINFERKEELFESSNISQRELRQADRDYEISKANLESLTAQLKVIGVYVPRLLEYGIRSTIHIKAPITGYISKVDAVSGSYVNMNSKILTIVNSDHKHLELEVYADRIKDVKEGQTVGFRVAGDDTEHWGTIYLVGKEVDNDTRTVVVHGHLLREDEPLVVGSYLYAGILTSADSLWSLPSSAIVNAENRKFVMVKEGEKLKSIEVELGNSFKNFVAISNYADLSGKEVVANDAYYYFEN